MKTSLMLLALSLGLAGPGWAGDADDDGPGRGVARISVINGDVSVRRGDSGDWVAAAINAPLVVEDRVLTGPASRAEVQFDYANMIRLSSDAEVRLAELEYQRYLIQVARGTVTFRVLRDSQADVEVSTPNVSVRPVKRGIYRVTVHDDGTSEITVRSGEADVYTPRGSERLRSGRTMLARGSASDPEYQILNAVAYDEWDRWNENRDRVLERAAAYRYVPTDVYGAEDLDAYGSWVYSPPYGWVWAPSVAPGWAPYRYGRWGWVDWYGWTWISYDPWGWAPFHYGRWFWGGSRWCWWPGALHTRAYWRPGLVAFFGFGGPHVGVGFGWGNVGWVPLAPYEPYYPWYGRRYYGGFRNTTVNNITVVNNVNITNVYRNARITNAVTGIDGGQFGRGHGNFMRVSDDQIRQANLARGPIPMTPDRSSLRWSDREARTPAAATRVADEGRFFSRRQPAQVERIPFDQQQRGMEQMLRRNGAESPRMAGNDGSRQSAVQAGPAGRTAETPRTEAGRQAAADGGRTRGAATDSVHTAETPRGADNNGWRRVAEPARQQERAAPVTEWRRFGESPARTDNARTDNARPAETPRATDRGAVRVEPRSGDSGNWRRFGDPGNSASPQAANPGSVRNEAPRGGSSDNPRRFESRSDTGGRNVESPRATPQRETPRSESPRSNDTPRSNDSPRSSDTPRQRFMSDPGAERLRMSPSIVHERPSEPSRPMAAPRTESPRMSAPAPRMEAPRMSAPSGGGGGGSRGGGGGSAPSHSGGGGGGSSSHSSGGGGGSHSSSSSGRGR